MLSPWSRGEELLDSIQMDVADQFKLSSWNQRVLPYVSPVGNFAVAEAINW